MSAPRRAAKPIGTAYEADVSTWAVEQAVLLRSGSWAQLDVVNLADEIETLEHAPTNWTPVRRRSVRPYRIEGRDPIQTDRARPWT